MDPLVFVVDAFTNQPFSGNPAGVCLLDSPRAAGWMQSFATEMRHSETAFLVPEGDGYRLRWFTPVVEVRMCGHATLASAHILYETGRVGKNEEIRFYTLSGLLTACRNDDYIELNVPANRASPAETPNGLLEALGIKQARFVGSDQSEHYLVEVGNDEDIRSLKPDFRALKSVDARSVVVTARYSDEAYDFVSRFFNPWAGVDEDPVTGSAHRMLGPYWGPKLGKVEMSAYQASARGGHLRVRLEGERVVLAGQAVTIFNAELSGQTIHSG